ncbi:MAG: ABC transporter substrate-binding protein [Clostridium sp.]
MKRKALAVLLSAVVAASALAGCSSKTAETTAAETTVAAGETTAAAEETKAASGEAKKIYLITMDQMDQHWVNVDKGAQKAAAELGNVEYKWIAPDVKDDAKQIECVNNAIAGGAQAIMIAANGPDAITASLKEAAAEGIKIIYVDSPANFDAVATLATDNQAAGKTAGETLIAALKEKNVTSGKIGVIGVNASTDSTVKREAGFRSAFEGTDFELLETQYSDGDAAKGKDIGANYITQGCVGLFGTNEGSTVGAGNAIQEAGGEVLAVGFDKSDMILQLIKNGYLVATMAQNPDVMGYEGVKTAADALDGKEPASKNVDTGVSVLDKATVQ